MFVFLSKQSIDFTIKEKIHISSVLFLRILGGIGNSQHAFCTQARCKTRLKVCKMALKYCGKCAHFVSLQGLSERHFLSVSGFNLCKTIDFYYHRHEVNIGYLSARKSKRLNRI
jgi:hypothetical protein